MGSRKRRFLWLTLGGTLILALALIAPSIAGADAHFSGSITNGDPTQAGRLFRDGVPDTCAAPGTSGLFDSAPRHYDVYEVVNNQGTSQCVEVTVGTTTCTGTNFIYSAGYSPTFNPANILENWQADLGSSPQPGLPGTYSFNLASGAHAFINVHEVTADAGCPDYTVDVINADPVGGPPPPPPPPPPPTSTVRHEPLSWARLTFENSCGPRLTPEQERIGDLISLRDIKEIQRAAEEKRRRKQQCQPEPSRSTCAVGPTRSRGAGPPAWPRRAPPLPVR